MSDEPLEKWLTAYQTDFQFRFKDTDLLVWYNRKPKDVQEKIIVNMLKCFIGLKIDLKNDDNYDKRCIVLVKQSNDHVYFLEPISPCFRQALYLAYSSLVAKLFLTAGLTNSIIGDCQQQLEKHLISLLRLKVFRFLEIVSINEKCEQVSVNSLEFRDFKTVEFVGYQAPEDVLCLRNTLYIPISAQYPGFDFVYYDIEKNAAFFVYITKKQEAFNYIITNDKKALGNRRVKSTIQTWKDYLPSGVQFFDVYLLLKADFININRTQKKWRACNVIYLEELKKNIDI